MWLPFDARTVCELENGNESGPVQFNALPIENADVPQLQVYSLPEGTFQPAIFHGGSSYAKKGDLRGYLS